MRIRLGLAYILAAGSIWSACIFPVQAQLDAHSDQQHLIAQEDSPRRRSTPSSRSGRIETLSGGDWRSREADIPWSEPVMVRDDFDGDYLAVFDRNYERSPVLEQGVISNWSRRYIRVFVYNNSLACGLFAVVCHTTRSESFEAKTLDIKIGERVFNLTGTDGNFPVTDELAAALANAPAGEARIRISLEQSGAVITNDIGSRTVASWRVVYGDNAAQR